jgi:methionyl-tRNA synthetase
MPEIRRNEVVSFVRSGLRDLSVSRAASLWGVPIPWDPKHVTYVWVDALLNYITAAGFGAEPERFSSIWPADVHMIGKDITRFHAVIWPAMLMAASVPLPRTVYAHGFLSFGGQKMSKSLGTGIAPKEVLDRFGPDGYRWYFLREVQFGRDGDFTWESLRNRYNAELANGLGNLASRVLAMAGSYFDGSVPTPSTREGTGQLSREGADLAKRFDDHLLALELNEAFEVLDGFIRAANRFLVDVAPWNLAKEPSRRGALADVLYEALEALRIIALLAAPAMPGAAASLWDQLGMEQPLDAQRVPEAAAWGRLEPGTRTRKGEPLFPRLEA